VRLVRQQVARGMVTVVWLVVVLAGMAGHAHADQTRIVNYDEARRLVWARLYPSGGVTLYCGESFRSRHPTLNVEHVYAASWMARHLGCGSRAQCRRSSPRFNRMEADLHNLYPDLEATNAARKDYRFGEIPGETPTVIPTCDFEHDRQRELAEPRPAVRGDIARALLYMERAYGLPLDPTMRTLIVQWHQADPPTAEERARNEQIAALQGTRNPFIDQPDLVTSPPGGAPSPVPAPPAPTPVPAVGAVRGNRASNVYHRPDCPDYDRISTRNRVEFGSEHDAQQAGYRRAGNCP
jgi:deoxyribonuclease-1